MGPKQMLPLQVRVDLGVMALKVFSTLTRSPELMPYQMQFSVIPRGGSYADCWRCPWCNGYCCMKWTQRHDETPSSYG